MIIDKEVINGVLYTEKADVWLFGIFQLFGTALAAKYDKGSYFTVKSTYSNN
jgi:hypothetical protein